jgi:putative transposase
MTYPRGAPCTTITVASGATAPGAKVHDLLRTKVRRGVGRHQEPRAAILDRQSVKTTKKMFSGLQLEFWAKLLTWGPERGYDAVKKVNGRKRHLLVDTLGLILAVLAHAADVGEREGARWLLEGVRAAKQAGGPGLL